MRLEEIRWLAITLLVMMGGTSCSSISLPSLPSMPWSSSAPKPDPTAEALFDEGMRYFKDKRYARAIDVFSKLRSDHPFSPQLTETELKIADSYYLNDQYPEAINAFKEFQSLHPTNENIPFVVYRLGQAHLAQFSAVDRDQKNTEIAKSYFEKVVTDHAKSPYAADAAEKLAKCLEHLAEHAFNVASFYLKQEKYPAARDRFEEIVRRYRGTPTAVKSLFYLGESYRKEKNNVKAALAYEALVQHYPQSTFAAQAKTQLAQLEKEKHDPLAMLLMRDRRPSAAPAPEKKEDSAIAKLKDRQLIAKTETVYEEPGAEKGIFRRVVDTINPFSSSGDSKKKDDKKKSEDGIDAQARKQAGEKEESPGFFASLWPFGSQNSRQKKINASDRGQLVDNIDDSLKGKGIASDERLAAMKPPAAALPVEEAPPQTMNTGKLLSDIDSTLQKSGKTVEELPPPEAAEGLRNPAAGGAVTPRTTAKPEPKESAINSGLLSGIDQKLRRQGVEPSQFEVPPPVTETKKETVKKEQPKKVELEPKLSTDDKGPLFLNPAEVESKTEKTADQEKKPEPPEQRQEPAVREIPKALVKGPNQQQSASPPAEQKKAAGPLDEENKGALDHIREDIEKIGNILNPFRW